MYKIQYRYRQRQNKNLESKITNMNTNTQATVGVVLGRFQLPVLHEGHKALIREVQKRHDTVILVIASTPVFLNRKNPLSGELRRALLETEFANQNVVVRELHNNPSNEVWSANFDRLLTETMTNTRFIIYGARDNSLKCYSGTHEKVSLNLNLPTSATDVRRKIAREIPGDKRDLRKFAEGVIYATHNFFPVSYTAVDLAIIREEGGKTQVLLCGKGISKKWFFCGGFVDPEDKTILDAVKREKAEELGINLEVDGYQFVGDLLIDDWRYRGTEHSIRSMFHVGTYQWGTARPADDIERTEWFELNQIHEVIADAHRPLADALKKHVSK